MTVAQCWRYRPRAVVVAWILFLGLFCHLAIISTDPPRLQDPRPVGIYPTSLQQLRDVEQEEGQGVEDEHLLQGQSADEREEEKTSNTSDGREEEKTSNTSDGREEEKTSNTSDGREEEKTSNTSDDVLRKETKNYGSSVVVHLNTTWTSEMATARREEYTKRLSRVQNICKTTKAFERRLDDVYRTILWDQQDQLMWCPVLKAASTTWMQNFGQLTKSRATETKDGKKVRMRKKSHQVYKMPEDPQPMLKSALKFLIVRHPFQRLLSAYRDKMFAEKTPDGHFYQLQYNITKQYQRPYSKLLTRRKRRSPKTKKKKSKSKTNHKKTVNKNNKKESIPACEDLTPDYSTDDANLTIYQSHTTYKDVDWFHPTFTQFLMRVRDDMHQMWRTDGECVINKHWRPYWVSCGPCQLDYTVIAKVETIDLDNEYIIQESNLQGMFINMHTHSAISDGFKSTSEAINNYFSEVPVELLKEIVELYEPDFNLFDYDPKPFLKLGKS